MIKFNRKTVTVITGDGRRWNVAPQFLSQIKDANPKPSYLDASDNDTQ